MKKVLLIGDSPLSDSPYIRSYMEVLEQNNIPYDLLFWNRHLDGTEQLPENYIPYNRFTDNRYPFWKRLYNIWMFARFASKWMSKNDYVYVVVFTIAHAIFMYRALQNQYKKRYVFDVRDYSPLCKIGYFRRIVERLVKHSAFTVVSSIGFLKWLPQGDNYQYVVSHNTIKEMIDKYIAPNRSIQQISPNGSLSILTIGQIRDYEANVKLLNAFREEKQIRMVYAGSGIASDALKSYVEQEHIKNALFTGRYKKEDEEKIVMSHDMINSYLNRDINSDTLMSNRFYLSVLMRKPIIANEGSFQSVLVRRYGLGIVLKECDDFMDKVSEWWKSFDADKYDEGCRKFLETVKSDIKSFQDKVVQLYTNTYYK